MSPVILWEIFDVTTTAVFPSAGSVTAITTAGTAQMRRTAVSVSPSRTNVSNFFHTVSLFLHLIVTCRAKALLGK